MSIQFLGLSSGTDWESVITQLVTLQSRPLEKLVEQRDKLEFDRSIMTTINKQLLKFDTALSSMRFESTFLSRMVESSNSSYVSAIAEAGAALGTYNTQIQRLADASRAVSGLEGQLYSKVANLSESETMGIASMTPYGDFQDTRALSTTLIKDTTQADAGGSEITAGDTINITGNLKDGTAVSGTFTFAGDSTDTLTRLGTTIAQVFQGEIAASVGTNGELTFIETDPSVAGDVTLNTTLPTLDLVFNDEDYSGSTLTFGIGNIVAGAGATARRLINSQSFTQAGVLELNSATDLANLDQVTGTLDSGDIIRINGTESGGGVIGTVDFTYTGAAGGQTIADLLTTISGAFTTATATYENGKIVLTDDTTGVSGLTFTLGFVDQGAATSMTLGSSTVAEVGRSASAQMVTTGSFTVEGTGKHMMSSSDGKGGRLRGTITISDPSNTLGSYIATEFDMFTIDVDGAGGGLDPVTITGLSEYSTVQDFIDSVNEQVPAVTAQLVDVGGSYRIELLSNVGGADVRVYDVANGILDRMFSLGATDLDTATNDLSNTFAATTDTDDVTIVDWFTPDNGGPMQRRVVSIDEGGPVLDLIGGVAINGAGSTINPGVSTVTTANSAELNTVLDMKSYLFGSNDIAVSPATSIPAIDPTETLEDAGFATTPVNASADPLNHTDGFFSINGVRITVGDVSTTTINEVLGAINTSGAGVTAYFDEANVRFYLVSNKTGSENIALGGQGDTSNFLALAGLESDAEGTFISGQSSKNIDLDLPLGNAGFNTTPSSGVFTINGIKIAIDAGVDNLEQVMDKITNSGAGVKATYDPIADLLTLTQKLDANTTRTRIELGDPADTSNFLEAVQLTVDTTVVQHVGSVRHTSQFSVNGVNFERNSNTVNDVIDKVTLTLNGITIGPEAISITADTDRTEGALVDFLVEYNTTMELINGKPLSRQERQVTAVLTEEAAVSMSMDEINSYLSQREEFLIRDFVAGDSSVRSMARRMQSMVTGLVDNDGTFKSLGQIGLTTAPLGGGVESAAISLGRLMGPTSDREAITSLIQNNASLQEIIRTQSDELYTLFANGLTSQYDHQGTRDLSSGIIVNERLAFTIGDGTNTTSIRFNAGTYSQSTILNVVNSRINTDGLAGSMAAFFDNQSQLILRNTKEESQAFMSLIDNSLGSDSILSALGWESGVFFGPDPQVSGGVARRSREYVSSVTGVGGVVLERLKQNGSFDRQVDVYNDAIQRAQENLDNYETRLRKQYERLEVQLSQLNTQSTALTQALAQQSAQNNN